VCIVRGGGGGGRTDKDRSETNGDPRVDLDGRLGDQEINNIDGNTQAYGMIVSFCMKIKK